MSVGTIEKDFIDSISEEIELIPDGRDRFYVYTPFRFNDGDHISIILKKESEGWILSDEGHTYMHLTYDIDEQQLFRGTRQDIISRALSSFGVEDRDGELILEIRDTGYGRALYAFAQSLLKITSVTSISRKYTHRKTSMSEFKDIKTFMSEFKDMMYSIASKDRIELDWFYEKHDPEGKYKVDCRINGMRGPLFVYALSTDKKVDQATIALYEFKAWEIPDFRSVGIIRDRTKVSRKSIDYFRTVADDCYPLEESRSKIRQILALTL